MTGALTLRDRLDRMPLGRGAPRSPYAEHDRAAEVLAAAHALIHPHTADVLQRLANEVTAGGRR